MTPKQHREELVALRKEFEQYYVTHAFNYAENPIGSRDCSVMWEGYQAGVASRDDEVATLRELEAQLAERDKIIALARDAISYALRKDYNCNGITCAKKLEEALAAIDDSTLVAGMVLCSTKRDRKRDAALLREADKVWWELDYGSFEKLAKARESGDWEPELEVK